VRRLVLIRHGRTTWNAEGRFQGQSDPPLDSVGERQATTVAAAVAPLRPAMVLSSDLRRAMTTAAPLVAATGARWEIDLALREVDLGAWEGLVHAEVQARYPAEYRDWRAGLPVRRGGGETEQEAGCRAAARIVAGLASLAIDSTLAVVAHGLVIQAAMAQLVSDELIALDGPPPHLGNGEWVCLDSASRGAACVEADPTEGRAQPHLPAS
jgi:probable phosphoglycerate mutase